MTAASRNVTFTGAQGDTIAAHLDLPDGQTHAWAVFAHCFTCSKDSLAAARIARALAASGIAVLRFDFTGLGDFGATDFSSNTDDLVQAADFLRRHHTAPTVLIGHSLGGAAVLAAAHRIPETRAVVTLGAPADPAHVAGLLNSARHQIEAAGRAEVTIAGRTFCVGKQFLDDIAEQPQRERIRSLDAALLVLHSPTDQIVSVEDARRIFEAARHPKSFIALDGADHLLTARADAEFVATMVAAWASRYAFGAAAAAAPTARGETDSAAEGVVTVAETGSTRYAQRITAGTHVLSADEPRPIGEDTGPSPYDLLLAGLGSCTSMTVRMYADRKGWPLRQVRVALRHSRIHAEDCAACETTSGRVDHIDRQLSFDGDLDDDQRQRLLEIADKCPVHRTLRSEIDISTTALPTAG